MPELRQVVREIAEEMATRPDRGEVASYIPELARVDARAFGLVVIDAEGNVAAGGHSEVPFSIQSISKVFTSLSRSARRAIDSGTGSGASRPALHSTPSCNSNTSAVSRAIRSSMQARSPSRI
jgi:glutaminase